ncbi:MAG: hypothetical protein KGK01_04565 [Bradyrhizobium sp.]|uniref:hypothetical protein n=1 Tax=Bradyrhizobium sp. TaxID=376 RepID=UPI001C29DFEE|nr:hypothetical protein [Bradyrhizobium sp.]MBU6462638.1 hypothetical protein [Pseudomonadota bacterium]MDE2067289.1 hypothetical protein [Bradyrhizobium sp.]MDE2241728.1 hypothetical protein [Bradyrhizobium sp.]MDE2469764.1 hypothetical protein [Bradyrhizobium sp.]
MKSIRFVSAVALLVVSLCPALAADPVFPPGSRVGLTPLVGLVPAKTFTGFETDDHGVKVLVAELPPDAYGEVAKAFKAESSSVPGVKPATIETAAGTAYYTTETAMNDGVNVRRYSMIMPAETFSGYIAVQVPENAGKIYTDQAIRQMFASAVVRKQVPVDEQLAQLPFKVTDLADFKNVRTLGAGAAVILADNDEATGFEGAPFMIMGLIGNTPAQPEDRDRFAQEIARTIPGIRGARLTMSEPIRIDSMPGFETRLDASDGKDNTPVTVVQWLRFGGPTVMRIIGIAPHDQWEKAFPRFRAVRDGIQMR